MAFYTRNGSPPGGRAAALIEQMDLAVHVAVLAALSGLVLTALMLLTGLPVSALLLLAGLALATLLRLALPTLLRISLLLLLARILLFIRHWDVLHRFSGSPPTGATITSQAWRGSYRHGSNFRQQLGK